MRPALLRIGAAASAGLAVALSLPPWGWWPLGFVGVAAFALTTGRGGRRRGRAGLGFVFAFVWLMVGTAWMWQLSVPGYLAANVVFAGYHAAAAAATPDGRGRTLGGPLAHTLVEALRLSFPFGGVPLATMGIAQAGGPLLGVARVGGVIALTWIVFQAGFVLAAAIARDRPAQRAAAVGASVIVAVVALAAVAPRGHGRGVWIDVAAVQGGGEQGTRALDVPSRVVTERHLAATAAIAPDPPLDLVLWPENVVDVADFASSLYRPAIAEQAARLDAPIAVGVTEDVPGEPDRFVNAQVVVAPDGEITSRYVKVRRVPFGEYVPLRGLLEALGAPVDQVAHDAVAGRGPAVLELPDGTRMAVAISWEVFFGGRVREGVNHGGGFVVNPTNGASYTGTIVQTQQVASSRLRAVETGRWVVQAAPTGFSAFVTPDGAVLDRTAVSEQVVIRRSIEIRTGRTWYGAVGDGPLITAALGAFVAVWMLSLRSRGPRRPARAGRSPGRR